MILVEVAVVALTIVAATIVVVIVVAVIKRIDVVAADLIIVAAPLCTRYAAMKCSNKTTKSNNYANYALLLFNCNLKNVVAS